ncbi:MAG: S-ribosylhomocysteine lyase [Bacillota bacterium]|jgi:S-ribosylhomocysteine lyase
MTNDLPRIASFSIDHENLMPGLYISRHDGDVVTYDLRMKRPNREPVLSTGSCHAIEHIAATFLRAHDADHKMIYFGPMGCRTGFYLLYREGVEPWQIKQKLIDAFNYIVNFDSAIPGATSKECGNYLDMDLRQARKDAAAYVAVLESLSSDQWYKY